MVSTLLGSELRLDSGLSFDRCSGSGYRCDGFGGLVFDKIEVIPETSSISGKAELVTVDNPVCTITVALQETYKVLSELREVG